MKAFIALLLLAPAIGRASAVSPGEDWSPLVAKVLPSVVSVEVYRESGAGPLMYAIPGVRRTWLAGIFDRIANLGAQQQAHLKATPSGGGAGFCHGGLILTAGHLFRSGRPERIVVELSDHARVDASVVSVDLSADVAILRTRLPAACPPVAIADMSRVAVGQPILAVGSPDGYSETVSAGIISGLREDAQVLPRNRFVQFDAPIYHGNSGGPIFNGKGEVVGMVSYAVGGGAQFAIPIDRVLTVASRLARCNRRSELTIGTGHEQ